MKKLLLSLFSIMLVGLGMTTNAQEYELELFDVMPANSFSRSGSASTSESELTIGEYTYKVCNVWWQKSTSNSYMAYKKEGQPVGYMVLPTFSDKIITKISMYLPTTVSAKNAKFNIFVNNTNTGTFIPNKNSEYVSYDIPTNNQIAGAEIKIVSANNNNQIGFGKLKITYTEATPVDPDALTPPTIEMVEEGEGFIVKMTADEGCDIFYTTDENEPTAESTKYTAPIPVEMGMSTTFKAIASKDEKISSSITYTATPPYILDNFSAFSDFVANVEPGQKIPVIVKGRMTVIAASYKNLYVQDSNKGGMLLVGGSNWGSDCTPGATFDRIDGNFTVNNQVIEIVDATIGTLTAGELPDAAPIEIEGIAMNMLYQYVSLDHVVVSGISGNNFTITKGESTANGYNSFHITNLEEGKNFNLTGIITSYQGNAQFAPTLAVSNFVPAPTFTIASGTRIESGTAITLEAQKGTIYYSFTEAGEYKEYPADGIVADTDGEMTIWAYAQEGTEKSDIVSATYTVFTRSPYDKTFTLDFKQGKEVYGMPFKPGDYYKDGTTFTAETGDNNIDLTVHGNTRLWDDGLRLYHDGGEVVISIPGAKITRIAASCGAHISLFIGENTAAESSLTWEGEGCDYFTLRYTSDTSNKPVETVELEYTITPAPEGAHTFTTLDRDKDGFVVITGVHKECQLWYKYTYNTGGDVTTQAVDHTGYTQHTEPIEEGETNTYKIKADKAGSIEAYTYHPASATKSEVKTITIESDLTGIDEVGADSNAPVEYYNLQGVRVDNPANGLYIKKQGSTVTKVLVK